MALLFSSNYIICQNPRSFKSPNFQFNQFSLRFPLNSSPFSDDLKIRRRIRAFSISGEDPGRSGGEDDEVKDVGVKAALSMLKFYKREISPLLPNSCRYVPTCSEYSMIAYKKYGVGKGTILTAWRLCRCNPLGTMQYLSTHGTCAVYKVEHAKCGTGDYGGVDRISRLPDEIILIVLSFLSVREAAATSLLSSRWSDLWKHTNNLDFNTNSLKLINSTSVEGSAWDVERCKYVQLVNSVIQSHKALSLKQFRICFYVNKSGNSVVAKWLEFVFSRQVRRLVLDFQCQVGLNMLVLEELLRESRVCQTDAILFKSLKELYLRHLKVSGEDIELFLLNCPLLMSLVIRFSTFTSDIVVCGTTLKLRHLGIRWCCGGKSIKVSAPNLTSIWVDKISGKLSIENVPKLVDVYFRNNKKREFVAQHFASAVSCINSQLKILHLTIHHPKEFMANGFPQMTNLKKLIVKDYGLYEHGGLMPVTAFIWACPRLQEFKLKFLGELKDATSNMEVATNIVERSRHQCLKKLEFQGVSRGNIISDHIVELTTYISDNCVALRKIVIGPPLVCRVEVQADRDCLKQKLQAKLPHRIQLQVFEPI